jgi:N6-adenosine-specific RNA methylase IME4
MKYRTIVIDPPWDVCCNLTNEKFYRTGRKLPYAVMTDEEIAKFPIDNFADENCDLFMWVTHSKLPLALKILQDWGFKYHVLLAWDKSGGVCIQGFYRRTELCIYAYRGKMGVNTGAGSYLPTLFKSRQTKHSEKPSMFYALLRARTREPRIDIFARKRHYGFDAWGNQVETQMQVPLELTVRDETVSPKKRLEKK